MFRLPLLKRLTIRHKKLIAVFFTLLVALLCGLTIKRSDPPRVSQSELASVSGSLETPTDRGTAATVLRKSAPAKTTGPNFNEAYGKLPLQFEPNAGQAAPDVEFLTRGSGYTLFLKQTEAVLSLRKLDVRLKVLGGNPVARISALDVLPGKVNHFIGNDTAKWRTNISTYKKVKYESVYPGIDLIYYGNQGRLEYDFIVAPETDPQLIQLSFPEAKELRIDQAGALIVKVQDVELRQPKPFIYQETATGRRIIDGNYILKGPESFAFQIDDYDHKEPLIIDPTLTYSTLLGTTTARSIAVDDAGNAYITGTIDSDVYVFKLNPTGTALVYATLIGGTSDEEGVALAVDSGGNVYVTGGTQSTDFPTVNAIQSSSGGGDAFVTKINSSGALIYSTYLGGAQTDTGAGIAVNSAGNAFVLGSTFSTDFPVQNAVQPTKAPGSNSDIFVSKFNSAGNALVYSTYLGGGGQDLGFGLALNSEDNVYITGRTDSVDFPTTNDARQSTARGLGDAFLTKLNSAGNALVYSSYHGGSHFDEGSAIAVHSDGTILVAGTTLSTDFPIANALQATQNSFDGFVTKFDPPGNSIVYSTYLGGDGFDALAGLATDSSGNVYITGRTSSTNFPLVQHLQRSSSSFDDILVAKLNQAGSALTFSTYLGSRTTDIGLAIAVRNDSIFVAGNTFGATDFPVTPGAFRQNHFEEDGSLEGFAVRIDSATTTNYYSISGRVTAGNTGMPEIKVTLSGSTSRTVRTDFDGRYSFHTLAEGGTYTVIAVPPPQFSFSPPSRTFANLNADQTGANFVVPGPPNDFFSNAQVISNTSGVINGTNAGATSEPGETQGGFASVWYRWQAPGTSSVVLNVNKSGMSMEVFTGSTINALTRVSTRIAGCEFPACNQSGATFKAIAGTVYIIRFASTGSTPGDFGFSFAPGVSISGQVRNINGRSLSDLTIKVNLLDRNAVSTTLTTDTGYSIVVPAGGNYSVVAENPSATVTSFVPVPLNNLNQDATNVDFVASSPLLTLSGRIHSALGANPLEVSVSGINFASRACQVTNQGELVAFFTCGSLPILGDYRIVPSTADYVFDPLERVFPQLQGNVDFIEFVGRLRSAPGVTTSLATSITPTSATLNGSVAPLGFATTGWFEWGTSPTLETSTSTAPQALGAGAIPVPISSELSGLTPGTTYFFRAVGMNSAGTQRGSIISFRAPLVPVQVTFQTNPPGRAVFVDGSQLPSTDTPQVLQWEPGSSHTISTFPLQAGTPGTQYVWDSWSDNGAVSHDVIAPATNTTYTANFTTQHLLTMVAGPGGTVSPSSEFFNSGQSVQISATPNSGFNFTGWTGTGSGSFSGSTNPATIMMNGPITQTAGFKAALRLMVENPGPVPDLLLALEAALLLRDPFAVINPLDWLNNGSDQNTRLIIFLQNFQPSPGELPSAVVVNLVGSNNQNFDIPADDVRPLANTDLVQVTFRLPDNLTTGNCVVKVKAHGETTNSATLRIGAGSAIQ